LRGSPSVAILGGTGDLGEGLALRLCRGREIIIGSRDPGRAVSRAAEYAARSGCPDLIGAGNGEAAARGDYLIIAAPASAVPGLLDEVMARAAEDALIVSPVVPIIRRGGSFLYDASALDAGSAAEYIARRTGRRVMAAFHTVPAGVLSDLSRALDMDVLVASGDDEFRAASRDLRIDGIRYLHAGPLEMARYLEELVPLLLNIGRRNGIRNPSIRVI